MKADGEERMNGLLTVEGGRTIEILEGEFLCYCGAWHRIPTAMDEIIHLHYATRNSWFNGHWWLGMEIKETVWDLLKGSQ